MKKLWQEICRASKIELTLICIIVLQPIAAILMGLFLYFPKISPFQPTLANNAMPLVTMVSVWAALLIAFATFRIIRANREREVRDRKENVLAKINDWTSDILTCPSETAASPPIGIKDEEKRVVILSDVDQLSVINWFLRYSTLAKEGKVLKYRIGIFNNEKLNTILNGTLKNLDKHRSILKERISGNNITDRQLNDSRRDLEEMIEKVLRCVAKLTKDLINI